MYAGKQGTEASEQIWGGGESESLYEAGFSSII